MVLDNQILKNPIHRPFGLASWATSGIRASLFDKEEDPTI
ncbi:hypothetical protein Taro_033261 [Colocasia esculenta]|uniref:Uncharacterized protein n=1 Tax=Colocasia esculenta TaxID=4460 RepID=A0A843VXD1_COLES|nr:hypothetical protein [Colocasia esculenta]